MASVGLALVAGGLTLILSVAAHAQPECQDTPVERNSHDAGRKQGAALVEASWDSLERNCRLLPRLEVVVRDTLRRTQPAEGASAFTQCRYAGLVDGAEAALEALTAQCDCQ